MGTSLQSLSVRSTSEDHPHAYGDKCITFCRFYADIGSSPRVWGQDADTDSKFDNIRIIPTRMGTSSGKPLLDFASVHHPHAYGDKLYSIVVPLDENGSSPRVWGQALVKPLCCAGKRIIPTRMGTRSTVTCL